MFAPHTSTAPAIPPVRKACTALALFTGLRAAELQGLRWSELHLDAAIPYVDVQRQLKAPATAAQPVRFKAPKKKSVRQVPLHPKAVEAMRCWKEGGWEQWTTRPPTKTDPVFPNAKGEFVRHSGALPFRADLVSAGLPPTFEGLTPEGEPVAFPFTFHATRRTFLTLLSAAAVPGDRIARSARHGQKGVTFRNYVARDLPQLLEEVLKLSVLNPVPNLALPLTNHDFTRLPVCEDAFRFRDLVVRPWATRLRIRP